MSYRVCVYERRSRRLAGAFNLGCSDEALLALLADFERSDEVLDFYCVCSPLPEPEPEPEPESSERPVLA